VLTVLGLIDRFLAIIFNEFPFAIIFNTSNIFGFLAIILAAVNIFGGFLVTQRMLQMYKKKKKDK